ncbi:MAG: hypothetical protein RLZZ458_1746, partial [Planctomycetota bacterium]
PNDPATLHLLAGSSSPRASCLFLFGSRVFFVAFGSLFAARGLRFFPGGLSSFPGGRSAACCLSSFSRLDFPPHCNPTLCHDLLPDVLKYQKLVKTSCEMPLSNHAQRRKELIPENDQGKRIAFSSHGIHLEFAHSPQFFTGIGRAPVPLQTPANSLHLHAPPKSTNPHNPGTRGNSPHHNVNRLPHCPPVDFMQVNRPPYALQHRDRQPPPKMLTEFFQSIKNCLRLA